jgi:hypothetical protein
MQDGSQAAMNFVAHGGAGEIGASSTIRTKATVGRMDGQRGRDSEYGDPVLFNLKQRSRASLKKTGYITGYLQLRRLRRAVSNTIPGSHTGRTSKMVRILAIRR